MAVSDYSSLHIVLDNPPEFYSNLDDVVGRVVLTVTRPETVGAIAVKLEGESKTTETYDDLVAARNGGFSSTSFSPISSSSSPRGRIGGRAGSPALTEDHKILYRVVTVFPGAAPSAMTGAITSMPAGARDGGAYLFQPGRYEWQFRFSFPLSNMCGNPHDLARMGGIMGSGGYTTLGQSLLGFVGGNSVRVMDGSKQLFFRHVTQPLPPSLTGLRRADIRYYIKTTVTRPGFLKENWRRTLPVRFMPVEPARPPATAQERFARRPFAFAPAAAREPLDKKPSLFGGPAKQQQQHPLSPPTIVMTARLPHPLLLTCNQRIPLRLIATKKTSAPASVYLVSLQVELRGITNVKCYEQPNQETQTWIVTSLNNLSVPLTSSADAPADTDVEVDDGLWRDTLLPHSVVPSFATCNISRTYELGIKIGITWAVPDTLSSSSKSSQPPAKSRQPIQTMYLSLSFKDVPVYSGIAPRPPPSPNLTLRPWEKLGRRPTSSGPSSSAVNAAVVPPLPPRPERSQSVPPPQQPQDPLYEDPPPSYDEVMADASAGPFDGPRYGSTSAFTSTAPAYAGPAQEHAGPAPEHTGSGDLPKG